MKRIGWLADAGKYEGGAEMAAREAASHAPSGVTVVPCPPDAVREDVDAYVVNNCTQYTHDAIAFLSRKPVVKIQHDVWPYGDPTLRTWLLKNARLFILGSPVQAECLPWKIEGKQVFVPHSVGFEPFRNAARKATKREGVIWIGRIERGKGIEQARAWAMKEGVTVDVYGYGSQVMTVRAPLLYKGQVNYKDVPALLARYEKFLFLPIEAEPYNRATVEAYAAGCELVVNRNVGPLWWIENDPKSMEDAHNLMWRAIEGAIA